MAARASVLDSLHTVTIAGTVLITLPIAVVTTLPLVRSHARRISIDEAARIVYFENVYVHKSFWFPRRMSCYACPFDDILWVNYSRRRVPQYFEIATPQGRIMFMEQADGFALVDAILRPLARERNVPTAHSTWLQTVVICVAALVIIMILHKLNWLP